MDVVAHIRELLYSHEYVIIPGFGGFIAKPTAAEIHPTQHTFKPPGRRIAFNQRLKQDDGLLINHIAQQENISQQKAQKRVEEFVRRVRDDLASNHLVILPKIGKLHYDIEKNLQFSPNRSINYALSSYGLPGFQFYPLQRKKKRRKRAIRTQDSTTKNDGTMSQKKSADNKKKNKKKRNVLTPVLVGIVLLLIVSLGVQYFVPGFDVLNVRDKVHTFTSSIFPIQDTSEQESGVAEDTLESTERAYVDTSQEHSKTMATDTGQAQVQDTTQKQDDRGASMESASAQEQQKEQERSQAASGQMSAQGAQQTSGRYFVVIGSFENASNAQRLASRLKNNGRSVEVLESGTGFHRVGFGRYQRQEAMNKLETLRDVYNPYAWVLKE